MNRAKTILAVVLSLTACVSQADTQQADFRLAPVTRISTDGLAGEFRVPPGEAGIFCCRQWLGGHTTREAITRDPGEMEVRMYGSASPIDAGGFNEFQADSWRSCVARQAIHSEKQANEN